MKKKKILFICPSLCQGGLEHFQISVLKMLDKEKYDITLFLYLKDITLLSLVPEHVKVIIDSDDNHYFRRFKAIRLNLKKKLASLFRLRKLYDDYSKALRDYIHKEKMKHPAKDVFADEYFDVVIANAIGNATEMALYISAKRRYVFYHGSMDTHHDLMRKLFPQFDGIIAVSSGVKKMLQKAYPMVKEKILLLENYIDAKEVLEKSKHIEIENIAISDENNIKVCSCGRLSPEKGFDLAVKAASILKEKGYKFKWYFIGDGNGKKKIEELMKLYSVESEICITGYMDNPFSIMNMCDYYVQPSYEESYGRTVKEAMILGLPIISTETVGVKNLIDSGKNGILTAINADALAEGIIRMFGDRELQKKCRDFYSVEQNLNERQNFIEGLERLLS